MPSVRQPVAALADRAERHVFATLPDLPAIDRRVLALLDLAGADRAAVVADTGLDEDELSAVAAHARKALRRTLHPLASGARCEHAERLISDRLDGVVLERPDRRWLEIHLARCPRCIEHGRLLGDARDALRRSFAAEPPPSAAPSPPPRRPPAERSRLRVVPAPAALEPAAEPPALEPAAPQTALEPAAEPTAAPAAVVPAVLQPAAPAPAPLEPAPPEPAALERAPEPPDPEPEPAPPAARPAAVAAAPLAARPRPRPSRAARLAGVALLVLALLAAAGAGVSALGGGDDHPLAPWARPGAPDVHPAPLSGQ